MAKKNNDFYFKSFVECATLALEGARLLEDVVHNFDPRTIPEKIDKMHEIEHAADVKKHETLNVLLKAFITPIDREDIIGVSQNIDEMCDKIEDVMLRIYINHIQSIRPESKELSTIVVKCCEELIELLKEFADFKHSKDMKDIIIRINSLEEEADKLYIKCMYELHGSGDALEIMAWRDIYNYLEKCTDTCEHVADIVESVALKNS
jgi:uncharacterized protein Yka (UPF0111/DUF47 family)